MLNGEKLMKEKVIKNKSAISYYLKKYKKIVILYLIIIILVTPVLVVLNMNYNAKVAQNKELYKENEAVKKEIFQKNMQSFEDVLKKEFTQQELEYIANKKHKISVTVDGQPVDEKQTTYILENNETIISVYEYYDTSELNNLPKAILDMGYDIKKEDLSTVFKIEAPNLTPVVTKTSKDTGELITYKYSNLPAGTIITFIPQNDFASKLNLENNYFELVYSKTDEQ